MDTIPAHLVSGGLAGIAEHCVMYPVDCIKTRMMTVLPNHSVGYSGLLQAISRIIREEKPQVLFRGIGIVAVGEVPSHALYFTSYEVVKSLLSFYGTSGMVSQGVAGAVASILHDGFMNPIEVVKQRLQLYNSPYRGTFDCARSVYKSEGLQAFYRSYSTQLIMNVPFQMVHFVTYEYFQDKFNPTRHYSPISHVFCGAGAGAIAAAITTPLDVARTFLNTYEQHIGIESERKVQGIFATLFKIHEISGIGGYFRGLSARVVFQAPSTAICWSVYELLKEVLGLKDSLVHDHHL